MAREGCGDRAAERRPFGAGRRDGTAIRREDGFAPLTRERGVLR